MDGLSENFSENKRGRGRPRRFPEEFEAWWTTAGIGINNKTRRGKMNRYYGMEAIHALADEPGLDWLFNLERMKAGTNDKVRWTILGELGRIEDVDTMREMAADLCKEKPNTAIAVSMVRELRTGGIVPASAAGLKAALHRTLDAYQMAHPGIRYDLIRNVLRGIWEEMKLEAVKALGPGFAPYLPGASGSKQGVKRPEPAKKAAKRKGLTTC